MIIHKFHVDNKQKVRTGQRSKNSVKDEWLTFTRFIHVDFGRLSYFLMFFVCMRFVRPRILCTFWSSNLRIPNYLDFMLFMSQSFSGENGHCNQLLAYCFQKGCTSFIGFIPAPPFVQKHVFFFPFFSFCHNNGNLNYTLLSIQYHRLSLLYPVSQKQTATLYFSYI